MGFVDPHFLHGQIMSLVPLAHAHHDNLVEAVQDGSRLHGSICRHREIHPSARLEHS